MENAGPLWLYSVTSSSDGYIQGYDASLARPGEAVFDQGMPLIRPGNGACVPHWDLYTGMEDIRCSEHGAPRVYYPKSDPEGKPDHGVTTVKFRVTLENLEMEIYLGSRICCLKNIETSLGAPHLQPVIPNHLWPL